MGEDADKVGLEKARVPGVGLGCSLNMYVNEEEWVFTVLKC